MKRKAKDGEIWVCWACGKTAKDPYDFSDAACFINSALCKEDSVVYEDGRAVSATLVKEEDE